MRVIITGGTGLIGSALAHSLVADNHEVIVLTRHPGTHPKNLPVEVRLCRWDARSSEGWGELADGAGAIVNLAGANLSSGRWTEKKKKIILESRVNAGKAVVQAVRQASQKPGVIIQASAVGYYGPHGQEEVIEEMPPGGDFLAQVCQQWEASTAEIENLGVRRAVIRTGVALSRKGGALPLMALPFRLFAGGPIGSGRQYIPWIHMDDEIAAIRHLIGDSQAHGPYNLSAPNPLTNRDFGKALARVLMRPYWIPVPALIFKILFGEMSIILLEGQKEIPRKLLKNGFNFRFLEAREALQEIYAA